MLHWHGSFSRLCELVSTQEIKESTLDAGKTRRQVRRTHLSCTLNSSSMSSSSQLSSHSLSPSDFAAPGATLPRCARSVCESSQSELARVCLSKRSKTACPRCAGRGVCGGVLTLDGKLLKLVVLFQHAEMRDLIALFLGLRSLLGCVVWLGCRGLRGHACSMLANGGISVFYLCLKGGRVTVRSVPPIEMLHVTLESVPFLHNPSFLHAP